MDTADQDSTGQSWFRTAVRCCVLIASGILAWPLWPDSLTPSLLPALSPYVALGSALALKSVGSLTLLCLPVVGLAMITRRWFCRNACPVGFLSELFRKLRPATAVPLPRWPWLGRGIVLLTLGGACLGYPLILWLDPLAIFSGVFGLWHQPLTRAIACAGIALPLVLLLDWFFPRLWCFNLCPLGATQELIFFRQRSTDPKVASEEDRRNSKTNQLARRGFLVTCIGAMGGLATRVRTRFSPAPLRPPGAVTEEQFGGLCVRCGNCIRVCPSEILQPDLGEHGLAGLLAPVVTFAEGYCKEDCHRCNQVCPSGAIQRLTLAEKRKQVLGPAKVDLETCLLALGWECTACIRACPYEALVLDNPDGGFSSKPAVDLKKCTGCGACELMCPVRPKRAIRVFPRPGSLA